MKNWVEPRVYSKLVPIPRDGFFYFLALLNDIVVFLYFVDWSGRRSTPAGVRGRGDPTCANAPRRLPGTPAGLLSAWSGNQQPILTEPFFKAAY